MERFPEGEHETRVASCPAHGEFESRCVLGRLWTRCPSCAEDDAAARREQEAQRAREHAERVQVERLGRAGIPNRFIGRTFETFNAESEAQKHALAVARDFAEQFEENARRGRGLILSGMPGTGKSHLATAILQTRLDRPVRYVTCMDMIREVRGAWRRDSERSELEILDAFSSLALLVIDEIGVQYGTDGEQTIIFDILDRRYRDVMPTVLLTNQDKAGLKTFIGERTFDRLTETCRWVPFDWPSYRLQARKEDTAESRPRYVEPPPALRGLL